MCSTSPLHLKEVMSYGSVSQVILRSRQLVYRALVRKRLHYVWFSWFWSHFFFCFCTFENVEKCVLGGCTITSKAKINVFWNFFFTPLAPLALLHLKKFQKTLILAFQKMLILAFEANSALSRENETKIVKITHSTALAYKNLIRSFRGKYFPG